MIPGVVGGDDVKLVRCMLPPYLKNRKAMQKKKAGYVSYKPREG